MYIVDGRLSTTDIFQAGPSPTSQSSSASGTPATPTDAVVAAITTSPTTAPDSGSLSKGQAAGIGIGSGLGAIALTVVVIWILYARYRHQQLQQQSQQTDEQRISESPQWRDPAFGNKAYHPSHEAPVATVHEIANPTGVGAAWEAPNQEENPPSRFQAS